APARLQRRIAAIFRKPAPKGSMRAALRLDGHVMPGGAVRNQLVEPAERPFAGEGEAACSVLGASPSLTLQPKSDLSDFGRPLVAEIGRARFRCKRGRGRRLRALKTLCDCAAASYGHRMKIDGKPWRTIWLEQDGWSVGVIDQTRLPHRFATRRLA